MAAQRTNREMLVEIDKKLDTHLEICKLRCAQVDNHEKIINGNGNGSLGLKTKVGILFWVLGLLASVGTIAAAALLKNAIGL